MVLVLRLIGLEAPPDVGHVALACVVSGVAWGQPEKWNNSNLEMDKQVTQLESDLAALRKVSGGEDIPPRSEPSSYAHCAHGIVSRCRWSRRSELQAFASSANRLRLTRRVVPPMRRTAPPMET